MKNIETREQAERVAALLNEAGQIAREITAESVLRKKDEYIISTLEDGAVIGAVRVRPVQWYQFEITHLIVAPEFRGKNIGKSLLLAAFAMIAELGGGLAQATSKASNERVAHCNLAVGFKRTVEFNSPITGNRLVAWQIAVDAKEEN